MEHIEKKRIVGHHANLKVIGGQTMGSLTIGFNGKNYIFPCREFKSHDSHLKHGNPMGLDIYFKLTKA